jgi:hypothetical protein
MAVSVKQPWANFLNLGGQNKENREDSIETEKDEALSISGDSSVYSEEGNIAKAARREEPTRQNWEPTIPSIAAPHTQSPSRSCQVDSSSWNPSDAAKLYNVAGWSEGYFAVSSDGHLAVRPQGGKPTFFYFHLAAEEPSGRVWFLINCPVLPFHLLRNILMHNLHISNPYN